MSLASLFFTSHRDAVLSALAWSVPLTFLAAEPAPASELLAIPAQPVRMNLAVKLPSGPRLDDKQRWQLAELGAPDGQPPIPVEIVTGHLDDGSKSTDAQTLVCSIPSRAGATETRRFRLSEASAPVSAMTPAFHFTAVTEKSLGVWEGNRPVFVYNHGILSKEGVPADRNRSTYLHPVYGLDGEVLTDDFPKDHYHHRGLFWAWPHVRIDGLNYDLWDVRGIYQRFERWLDRRPGASAAVLGVENGWYIGDQKMMQERVWFTVYPATASGQVIDLDCTWIPTEKAVTLAGAEEKSYGGLTLRYAPRTDTVITTPLGNKSEDLAMTRLPWADLSARFTGAREPSGAAIFIGPDHPDYPPTWLTRHYGALCVGWPGVTPATFQPGQRIQCRYRIWIHRGSPAKADLEQAYQAYSAARNAHWQAGTK
jgi:hypothetical protein